MEVSMISSNSEIGCPKSKCLSPAFKSPKGCVPRTDRVSFIGTLNRPTFLFVDEQTAKISHFGLAGAATQGLETEGVIWGTPYYVAPERLNNEPEGFRSDIYSLGATLFHAVAGKAPIEGNTNSAMVLLDLKKQPLDLRAVAPEVSGARASIFQRMIAPDPTLRFSSYDELVAELEQAQRTLPGIVDLARRRLRRWLPIGAVLLIMLAVMMSFFLARKPYENAPAKALPKLSGPFVEIG